MPGSGFADKLLARMVVPAFVIDAHGRALIWNKACERLTGIPAAEVIGTSDHWRGFYDTPRPCLADLVASGRAADASELYTQHRLADAGDGGLFAENWCVMPRIGERRYLAIDAKPIRDEAGRLIAVMETLRDMTEQRLAEDLRDAHAHVLEMITFNAALNDVLDRLLRLTETQIERVYGSILLFDEEARCLRHAAAPHLPKAYVQLIDGLPIGPAVGSCGTAAFRGTPVWVSDVSTDPLWRDYRDLVAPFGYRSCWSVPILSDVGGVLGTLALYSTEARDPTPLEIRLIEMTGRVARIAIERKRSEERIRYMAHHDPLTGLFNRSELAPRLRNALERAERDGKHVAVALIDLDNFKAVNDSLGHNAGDELLRIVAGRIAQRAGPSDFAVRLGGDEFVLVLGDLPPGGNHDALDEVRRAVGEAVCLDGMDCRITASVGAAYFPGDGRSVDDLLANADAAMYGAKEVGRDALQFYSRGNHAHKKESLALIEELRQAITRSEFRLLFQPKVDIVSHRIGGVEALIRWQHPKRGLLAPSEFIPAAEKSGLIVPIGDWVLHAACRQAKAWHDAGLSGLGMAVNVSARQFSEANLVSRVQHALDESGLDARHLELELTESLIMHKPEEALERMNALTRLGVRFAIDDFGTGYSNLGALRSFPISCLKIDRSFVAQLLTDERHKIITTSVILLGRELNMRIVAEGVESEQQLAFLAEQDCDEVQGYLFSKPVPADEIESMVVAGNAEGLRRSGLAMRRNEKSRRRSAPAASLRPAR